MAVDTVIPCIVEVVVTLTESLGVVGIHAVDVVDATAQTHAFAAVGNFFGEQPRLVQIHFVRMLIEECVVISVVAELCPTAKIESERVVLN